MSPEGVGTLLAVLAFTGGMVRWLINAWRRAVMENPKRDTVVLANMTGIVEALNGEIDRVQLELDKLREMVKVLEGERDHALRNAEMWKGRAIEAGWRPMRST